MKLIPITVQSIFRLRSETALVFCGHATSIKSSDPCHDRPLSHDRPVSHDHLFSREHPFSYSMIVLRLPWSPARQDRLTSRDRLVSHSRQVGHAVSHYRPVSHDRSVSHDRLAVIGRLSAERRFVFWFTEETPVISSLFRSNYTRFYRIVSVELRIWLGECAEYAPLDSNQIRPLDEAICALEPS